VEVVLVGILVLNPGRHGLEYKGASFFIATMIETASYKMILQIHISRNGSSESKLREKSSN